MSDLLTWLQAYYRSLCDGEWEHHQGVNIETCDNPGWLVKIALVGTMLADTPFASVAENVDGNGFPLGNRWLSCCVENHIWRGAGDETKLAVIVQLFLAWANENTPTIGGVAVLPVYAVAAVVFRVVAERIIPRIHLHGVKPGATVKIYRVRDDDLELLTTAIAGDDLWVNLSSPIAANAWDELVAIPESH